MKAVLRYGKKQFTLDENKRDTYEDSLSSGHEPSVFTTFEGELKQLMVVCVIQVLFILCFNYYLFFQTDIFKESCCYTTML